jgi:hypothetical protein
MVVVSYLLGSLALLIAGPHILYLIGARSTLLGRPALTLLLLVLGLEMHHSLFGALVITENRNPFVIPALVSGVLVALAGWRLAPLYGYWGLLLAQGVVQAAFNNWWTVWRGLRGLEISPPLFFRMVLGLPSKPA